MAGVTTALCANREVSFLQAAFNWARGQGVVRDNPCVGVQRNEEESRTRMITDVELDAFVEFCRSNGHLKNDSERKESSDAGLRIALAARIAYLRLFIINGGHRHSLNLFLRRNTFNGGNVDVHD